MSQKHVFSGITQSVFDRMRVVGNADELLQLDAGGRSGTIGGPSPFGEIVIRFVHDIERAELDVTIVKKPKLLPSAVIWSGISHLQHRACSHDNLGA
jgi:hypothetical protein